jgi:AcrR family transcriptional regulator
MNKRDERIIEAALQVFMRYGIRRTTMNDIANEAGLVRQTLYTAYSNKDEVLCATIRYFSDKSLTGIKTAWDDAANLDQKLEIYFEQAIIWSFGLIKASPDAMDMIDGYNEAGKAELQAQHLHKLKAFNSILAPYKKSIRKAGLTVDQLGDFIINASLGIRNNARDETHLKSMLAALKSTVLSVTGE